MAKQRDFVESDGSLKVADTLLAEDYHQKTEGTSDDGKKDLPFLPFRFTFVGTPNLRGQSTTQNYKTFIGKQKN
jgi:hypothetical protein